MNTTSIEGFSPTNNQTVLDYLDGAGNHEYKNLLAGVYLENPQRAYLAPVLSQEINDRQGSPPAWKMTASRIAEYSGRSLLPIAVVLSERVLSANGVYVNSWQADPKDIGLKLATSGLISSWSLRWPDHSVQPIYGSSSSPSQVHSPQARQRIFDYLAYIPDHIAPIVDICGASADIDYKNVYINMATHINALVAHGILLKTTKHTGYDPQIRINSTEFNSHSMKLSDAIPETQALYKALGKQGVGKILTINQLVDAALKIDRHIDDVKLRDKIRLGVTQKNQYPGLELVGEDVFLDSEESLVELTENASIPIGELVDSLKLLSNGDNDAIEHYQKHATAISHSPEQFAALITKARKFSPSANRLGSEVLKSRIQAIVENSEDLSAKTVQQNLSNDYNAHVSLVRVRYILKSLVESGAISARIAYKEDHSRVKTIRFSGKQA